MHIAEGFHGSPQTFLLKSVMNSVSICSYIGKSKDISEKYTDNISEKLIRKEDYSMIKKIFNADNPFWQMMNTVFDLFILNTLWLLCCIPVITIGPSTTAAFYALIQRARGEETEIHKDFFRSFRQNLKQGIVMGLILTLTGTFLWLDMFLCRKSGTGIYSFFLFFFAVIFLAWAMTALYSCALLAKFDRKTREIFLWAFTLSIKNIGSTLIMLFVIGAGLWLCHILPGLLFIMFGLTGQYCAMIFAGIFKPWLPKPWRADEAGDGPAEGSGNVYADFDEASFYGYDPEEMQKLIDEGKNDEE